MVGEKVEAEEDGEAHYADLGHVGDEDVSIDSDEREFLDNISWDTSSDEEDVELDNRVMDDALQAKGKLTHAQEEVQMRIFEDNYDFAFHEYKRKYTGDPYFSG